MLCVYVCIFILLCCEIFMFFLNQKQKLEKFFILLFALLVILLIDSWDFELLAKEFMWREFLQLKQLQLYDIQRFTHIWMGLIFSNVFFFNIFFRIQKKCFPPSRPHPFLTTLPIINFNIELCFYATCHYSNSNYFYFLLCAFFVLLLLLLLTFSFTIFNNFPFPSFQYHPKWTKELCWVVVSCWEPLCKEI